MKDKAAELRSSAVPNQPEQGSKTEAL